MSATFSITKDQVITAALQICQAIGKAEAADSTDLADGLIYLQAMLKFWDTQGKKMWLYRTSNFPSQAAKTSYTLGESAADVVITRPIAITQAYCRDGSNNDIPLSPLTRQQYENLTPKNNPGQPNSFYYDPQLGNGVFYAWPILPDTSLTFFILCQRPIDDIGSGGSSTFDVPKEAYLALIWGLAEQLMSIYSTEETQCNRIEKKAALYLEVAMDFAEEEGSTFFMPSAQMRMR